MTTSKEKTEMEKKNSTADERSKENTNSELNDLGLTKEQALKLNVFKFVMEYNKNITSSFDITQSVIKWVKSAASY